MQRTIEEIAGFLESDARQHDGRVRFDIADDMRSVRGDPIQLQQVIMILVRNALEAFGPAQSAPREVVVKARDRGPEGVVICVSDRGVGLDTETSERLFEPFFTTKPAGLGLGLAIARSVVEGHGGRLWAETNADRGATFHLMIPPLVEERS